MASVDHCLYCFEVLAAKLEHRNPMSLYQVQASWADYPKGLDDEEDDEEEEGTGEHQENSDLSQLGEGRGAKLNPALQRLGAPRSNGTSTPSSGSSSSILSSTNAASTANSSVNSSSSSFTPIGIGRRTSQRSADITESPLFVTWNKISATTGAHNLRGCIGTFEAQPLSSGLASYALTSALSDTRFNPVTLSELPKLEVDVTLLTDFEPCADAMDWELGVHGLRVSFYHHHKRFGATYLPDVAVEQGWTKDETLVSLMRKAGWSGRTDKWKEVADLKVTRYQGKKESVDWDEYKRWKSWASEQKK